jgi:hypothetical protein
MREADVGSPSAATIKLKFRIDAAVRAASVCTEVAQVPGKSGKNSPEVFSNIFLSGGLFRRRFGIGKCERGAGQLRKDR